MDKLISEYRKEFQTIINAGHSKDRKDMRLSNLLTKIEKELDIKIFGSNKGNPAIDLYKEIAQARSM